MKVYKFGGASVQNADNVRNVERVLHTAGYDSTIIVVSAMGKTTNALEEVTNAYFKNDNYIPILENIENDHLKIARELFTDQNSIFNDIKIFFADIHSFLRKNKSPNYNFVYDQIVSYGELISTKIVSEYLNCSGITNIWLDIRDYIKTNDNYREGKINWELTQKQFENFDESKIYVTQGFLAADPNYFTVTLGKEGSDYSAAIIAYCLNAKRVTFWKDVPGIMNADPKYFKNAQLLNSISYKEAIELAFYGASIIHPKTIQPLLKKEIPFSVCSFIEPEKPGTSLGKGIPIEPTVPCFIRKINEHLLTISSLDFSFMQEENLSIIFTYLSKLNIKVNMISVSAISVSLCIEDKFNKVNNLIDNLKNSFKINIINNVSLYTIRHSTPEIIFDFLKEKTVLLEQLVKETYQVIVKE